MSHKGRKRVSFKQPTVEAVLTAVPQTQGEVVPPLEYAPNIVDIICEQVLHGKRLRDICAEEGMPPLPTVMRWLNRDPGFMNRYLESQQVGLLLEAEDMQDIADGKTKVEVQKITKNSDGEEVETFLEMPEDVQRSTLRVKTLQWRLTKLVPAIYGEKIEQKHTAAGDLLELLNGATNVGHKLPDQTE